MKQSIKTLFILSIITIAIGGCTSKKVLSLRQIIDEAQQLSREGRYGEAFAKYAAAAPPSIQWDSLTYRNATIAAGKSGNDSLVCIWGRKYSSKGDGEKLKVLESGLNRRGMHEERTNLILENEELFFDIIGEAEVAKVEGQFFAKTNDPRLSKVFDKIKDKDIRTAIFDKYFKQQKQAGKTDNELVKICKHELSIVPDLKEAIRFVAKTRYVQANGQYDKAMAEYNKKKSQAAYAYLTRDLKKIVTPSYRESRDYFEKLLKLEPDNKDNVKYLINIYSRLDNKDKVKELQKRL